MPKENLKEIRDRNRQLMDELYTKSNILDDIRLANEAIQLYHFIDETQSMIAKSKKEYKQRIGEQPVLNLDLNKVSNLPTDLILFIRDFIPYEIRIKLMKQKFNVYAFIKPRCSDVDIIKDIVDSPNFQQYFDTHLIYHLMYDRTTFNTQYLIRNGIRYNQNKLCTYLRFKSLFLLFKTTYPKFAFTILKTLKNMNSNITASNLHLKI